MGVSPLEHLSLLILPLFQILPSLFLFCFLLLSILLYFRRSPWFYAHQKCPFSDFRCGDNPSVQETGVEMCGAFRAYIEERTGWYADRRWFSGMWDIGKWWKYATGNFESPLVINERNLTKREDNFVCRLKIFYCGSRYWYSWASFQASFPISLEFLSCCYFWQSGCLLAQKE